MIMEKTKGDLFVEHIQKHLEEREHIEAKPKGVVICKICGKSVDEIAKEASHNNAGVSK